jgi:hypothetical protein
VNCIFQFEPDEQHSCCAPFAADLIDDLGLVFLRLEVRVAERRAILLERHHPAAVLAVRLAGHLSCLR